MAIKHFIVKVKNIKFKDKGLKNLVKYLVDEKRHKDGIINFKLFNSETFFLNVCKTIEGNEKKKILNGKGGRKIESYGDSYIFSFPKTLKDKLSNEKINEITNKLIQKLFIQFNKLLEKENKEKIDLDTFLKYIFVNVHTNQHTHINVVFSKVFELKKENSFLTNRITNRKKFIELSKHIFDEIIEQEFQLKKEMYEAETNIHKGYKNIYFKKVIDEVKNEKNEIEKLKNIIELKRKEIKEFTEKITKENEHNEKIVKVFQLLIRNYKKLQNQNLNNEMKGILNT